MAAVRMDGMPAKYSIQLLRLTPGKTDKMEERPLEVALSFQPWGSQGDRRFRQPIPFGTAACVAQSRYFLGTKTHGIFAFPLDGATPERITVADGLPSDYVQALAGLDGRLYAVLGEPGKESYVIAWDLKLRKCEVLASSRRKDKRSPFDDHPPMVATALLTDSVRHRLLLLTFCYDPMQPALNGLWALDTKGGKFSRLFPLRFNDKYVFSTGGRVEGDRLILNSPLGPFVHDLAKNDPRLLYDDKISLEAGSGNGVCSPLGMLPAYKKRVANVYIQNQLSLVVDGWLWIASPFSRRTLDGEKQEELTTPRAIRDLSAFAPTESLQFFRNDREVLLGDSFGLWLITLRKD